METLLSKDVMNAHLLGDIDIRDIDSFTGLHKVNYPVGNIIKKGPIAFPKKDKFVPTLDPREIADNMVRAMYIVPQYFSNYIEWDAVNVFFAPYLSGMDYKEIEGVAHRFMPIFHSIIENKHNIYPCDFHLYYSMPKHLADMPVISVGKKFKGKTYGNYQHESEGFLQAILNIMLEPFASWARPVLHINNDFLKEVNWKYVLYTASILAFHRGRIDFAFDWESLGQEDYKKNSGVLQDISINMPRIAYNAMGNDEILFSDINEKMELIAKAYISKKNFINNLLNEGTIESLSSLFLFMELNEMLCYCSISGLNQMIKIHKGLDLEMNESDDAFKFALKIMSHMNLKSKELSDRYNIKMVLSESLSESSFRFSKIDRVFYPHQTQKLLNDESDNLVYNDGIDFPTSNDMNFERKIYHRGMLQAFILGRTLINIDKRLLSMGEIEDVIMETFRNTHARRITFSKTEISQEFCNIAPNIPELQRPRKRR